MGKNDKYIKDIMALIEKELNKPQPNEKVLEKLNEVLDRLLGTELQEEDYDRAEAWERSKQSK